MPVKQSARIAFGGIMTALALTFLLFTISPLATVALAALAGVCGLPVVVELGKKAGLVHYVATALIALLLIPAPEGKVMYTAFFGYYTILKAWIEPKNLPATLEWGVKLGVFLVGLGVGGGTLYFLLEPAFPDWFALWMIPAGVVALCVVFVVYDIGLTRLVGVYFTKLRPHLQKVFRFPQ